MENGFDLTKIVRKEEVGSWFYKNLKDSLEESFEINGRVRSHVITIIEKMIYISRGLNGRLKEVGVKRTDLFENCRMTARSWNMQTNIDIIEAFNLLNRKSILRYKVGAESDRYYLNLLS